MFFWNWFLLFCFHSNCWRFFLVITKLLSKQFSEKISFIIPFSSHIKYKRMYCLMYYIKFKNRFLFVCMSVNIGIFGKRKLDSSVCAFVWLLCRKYARSIFWRVPLIQWFINYIHHIGVVANTKIHDLCDFYQNWRKTLLILLIFLWYEHF